MFRFSPPWKPRRQAAGSAVVILAIVLVGCSRGDRASEAQRPAESRQAQSERSSDEAARAAEMARAEMMTRPDPTESARVAEMPVSPAPEIASQFRMAEAPPSFERKSSRPSGSVAGLAVPAAEDPAPLPSGTLPSGAIRTAEGFATVQVYYATDRQCGELPLSAYQLTGRTHAVAALGGCSTLLLTIAGFSLIRGRRRSGAISAVSGGLAATLAVGMVIAGQATIEKHGVTYSGDRGQLTRGVCEVTVPDTHRRGRVERPSLLRFEIRENQQKHVVLTSAVELSGDEFERRLAETVAESPGKDLLVFIHGYNVDFESAVRRTAQIAVDLPFEGVPVCYSWPSQGSLIGYSIDENNSQWTVAHLKQFLLELAEESGAESINVVAHSMGNRALTAAIQQISWELDTDEGTPFDRIVLAAPDVDADHFRRDLAPALLKVANQVTLYASSDDQALIASKRVHGYPRAGESGENIVVVAGIETIDVSGIDLSILGHSYYGDNESILRDLYEVIRARLPATKRVSLVARQAGSLVYWQLSQRPVPNLR
jgi:esterase/lipase superfamily enzyme